MFKEYKAFFQTEADCFVLPVLTAGVFFFLLVTLLMRYRNSLKIKQMEKQHELLMEQLKTALPKRDRKGKFLKYEQPL